ncbi:ABC transporter permease [Prochlorococcus marinus XMU1414]|uniref:ABC-2 family transporter protein n=1 Tax=Prochlorococcus marinus XMU1424 TaxID=2774497 RepID=A0A9D9BZR7_PROMR|nr:ABC-2 family transporter protein [Prochlorococcus marinus]MBO8228296.1 ABC transporter permease [Prochlorococcus marinus XMU1414]MBW3045789.1 ABC transporter permease [Prochlorococcus marinus str. MU1414]MCR8531930.1 ABC-2 family transporter protein [Prochlorococcus marinus XMU1420]MCR8536373.1 ABC-2 family transporter protein [Prochlorococcus marinus XMU1424]
MNLRKYLKVYKKFLHTSLASELEYKTNILVDLITAILSLVGSIFLLSIFFQNNRYIGGWEFEQALIIQAIYTILNGITNTWFNPNLTEIVKHIREGTLDFVLLKPIDSQFFISLKKINPSGFLEIMLGFLLLLFCIRINQIILNLSFLTLSSITISCSICILYSLWFFISTTTIWFVKTWNAIEVLRSFLYIGRFPLSSFSFSLRIFFSVFIPIAFITTIPSEVFLGLSVLWKILLEVIVATVFLITSRKFWLFAIKFYSSASS